MKGVVDWLNNQTNKQRWYWHRTQRCPTEVDDEPRIEQPNNHSCINCTKPKKIKPADTTKSNNRFQQARTKLLNNVNTKKRRSHSKKTKYRVAIPNIPVELWKNTLKDALLNRSDLHEGLASTPGLCGQNELWVEHLEIGVLSAWS